MEGLVILLADLLLAPLVAALALAADLAVAAIGLAVSLLVGGASGKTGDPREEGKPPPARRRGIAARVARIALAFAVLAVLGLAAADAWFFGPTVRWLADGVAARTGTDIQYTSVDGSLLRGRLHFTGFEAVREGHPRRDFAFAVDEVLVDLDLLSLAPMRAPAFQRVTARGITGWIVEHEVKEYRNYRRPGFEIANLLLKDLSVTVQKPGRDLVTFKLDRIEGAPFRSRFAIFDSLFRSSVTGTVNDHPVLIATEREGERRTTKWTVVGMPVAIVAAVSGRAPFTWFAEGLVDIAVQDEWRIKGGLDIDMDWRFAFHRARLEVPGQDAGLTERALALASRKFFEAKGGSAEIAFRLRLNQQEFKTVASGDAKRFAETILDGYADALAGAGYLSKEELKTRAREAADRVRRYLDRRRKN